MEYLKKSFDAIDFRITSWMARYGILFLRISLGVVFLWFGILKFFPGLSPAQDLVSRTISVLSFGLLPPGVSVPLLAAWESLIGLGLIFGVFMRGTLMSIGLSISILANSASSNSPSMTMARGNV